MIHRKEEKCTACHLCEIACSGVRLGVFNPTKANLEVVHENMNGERVIHIKVCDMCGQCIQVCPLDAITEEWGYLEVDLEKCTGCEICVEACPQQIIRMVDHQAIMCNLCKGAPQCVEWCPQEALVYQK